MRSEGWAELAGIGFPTEGKNAEKATCDPKSGLSPETSAAGSLIRDGEDYEKALFCGWGPLSATLC